MTYPSCYDFATHDESAYPELWDGVIGAWAPCLGPTGSRLHDHSRRSNWGTLTNMDNATDWAVDRGQYSLDVDGSNDYIDCGTSLNSLLFGQMTIAAWARFNSLNTLQVVASNLNSSGDSLSFQFEFGRVANKLTWLQTGASVDATSTATITDNAWHFIIGIRSGTTGAWIITLGIDNSLSATNTASNSNLTVGILAIARGGSFNGGYMNGAFSEVTIWNRPLSINEALQLYQLGRGGMYQRRRRSRIYIPQAGFQAAWARGSNVLLGFQQP